MSFSRAGLKPSAIAGITIGCVALLSSVIVAFYVWHRRRKSPNSGKGKQGKHASHKILNLLSAEPAAETRSFSPAHPSVRPWRQSESQLNVPPEPAKLQRELLRGHRNSPAVASPVSFPGAGSNRKQDSGSTIGESGLQVTSEQAIVAPSLPVPPLGDTVTEWSPSPPPPYVRAL